VISKAKTIHRRRAVTIDAKQDGAYSIGQATISSRVQHTDFELRDYSCSVNIETSEALMKVSTRQSAYGERASSQIEQAHLTVQNAAQVRDMSQRTLIVFQMVTESNAHRNSVSLASRERKFPKSLDFLRLAELSYISLELQTTSAVLFKLFCSFLRGLLLTSSI
jgi:hypothetical protein